MAGGQGLSLNLYPKFLSIGIVLSQRAQPSFTTLTKWSAHRLKYTE